MPVYEYRCRSCGAKFEKFVRAGNGSSETKCPTCESEQVEKVFSVFGTMRGSAGVTSGSSYSGGSCAPSG